MRRKNTTTEMMMGYMCSALLELMLEKDYAKISIGEIAKKAGVDRSSYYRHFKSKEDIISFFFDMVLKESLDGFTNLSSIDFTLYIHSIYMAFYNYKKEVLLIYRSNLSSLLLDVLSKRFQFSEIAIEFPLTKQYELSYIIGGIYNNLIFWMSRDMNENQMKTRMKFAKEREIPMTNYGIAIAYMNGILKRAMEPLKNI